MYFPYLEFSHCVSALSCFSPLSFFLFFKAALSLNELILYALLGSKALAAVKGRIEILCSPRVHKHRPLWVPPAWHVDSDGRQVITQFFWNAPESIW